MYSKKIINIIIVTFIVGLMSSNVSAASTPPGSFSDIVNKRTKAIVNISTVQVVKQKIQSPSPFLPGTPDDDNQEKEFNRESLGTGFILDSSGYILTNNHVIENASDITVTLWDESEYKAKIKGRDSKTDIALLKIDANASLPAVPLGDSDKLEIGDWVIAIGNPYGLGHTVTAGIVSAKSRFIGASLYDDFIQTDAAINPGNSGGPLLNAKGEVVGINSAIIPMAQGIGFAIPINIAKGIMDDLKTKGYVERGWFGITVQKVTPELAETLKLPTRQGALVTNVTKDSPADKANIKRKDLIVEFAGEKVNERSLPRLVASVKIGSVVVVKVIRDGKPVNLKATISKLNDNDVVSSPEIFIADMLGIKTKTINPEIANQFGIMDGGGVIITGINPKGPASKEDIQVKDIIIEANGRRINSTDELVLVVKNLKNGEKFPVLLKRGGSYFYSSLRIKG